MSTPTNATPALTSTAEAPALPAGWTEADEKAYDQAKAIWHLYAEILRRRLHGLNLKKFVAITIANHMMYDAFTKAGPAVLEAASSLGYVASRLNWREHDHPAAKQGPQMTHTGAHTEETVQ